MAPRGEVTREKILDEAIRLYNRQGIESTSINDLLAVTGLTKGSLYFHFQSKDELSCAVLEKAKVLFLEFLDKALTGKTPGESLDNFFKQVVETHKSAGFVGGCLFGNAALELSDKDRRMASLVGSVFDEWLEKIRSAVRAAQAAGQVRDDLPADVLARHIVMAIEGGIMLARLKKSEKHLKDCLKSLRTLIGLKR
jgi:TetR/AcrR family transcriptional repressor of nem operon